MRRLYFCPKCGTTLNPNLKVVLTAVKGKKRGLILLSPQPGNYRVFASETLELEEGDRVTLLCPVCHEDLKSKVNGNLVEMIYRDTRGEEGRVNISRNYGEHATYFVTQEEVRSFGDDADEYGACNFFGEVRRI